MTDVAELLQAAAFACVHTRRTILKAPTSCLKLCGS